MLQYLINLTGIWLLSLAVFDLFLRKESYHNYNRLYLLATMLAGIIVPTLKWQDNARRLYPVAVEEPIGNVIKAKGSVVAAAESTNTVSWEQWLLVLYIVGIAVAASLLIKDILKLVAYYRSGKKSVGDGWTVVETSNGHAPFSFFNLLFVSNKADYNAEEWQMILQHERRHTKLRHFSDLLLLQLSKIAFWFHPLVYIYSKRLLLVHEYQADNIGSQRPQVYGRFLVEQAVLHAAPSVTHSFNRSPIKKRIHMLTSRSSAIAKTKMALVLPLTIACLVLFSQISYSKRFERQGNKITYRGNTFELGKPLLDTFELLDPVSGATSTRIVKHPPVPEKINGKKIYKPGELTAQPQVFSQNGSIQDYVFRKMSGLLNQLPDGNYDLDINAIVIDKNGKIVYYEGDGLRQYDNKVTQKMKDAIADKIDEVMNNAPALKPGQATGNSVASLYDIHFTSYEIEVKGHQSSLKQVWK